MISRPPNRPPPCGRPCRSPPARTAPTCTAPHTSWRAPGSALSLSHGTADLAPERMAKLEATYNSSGVTVQSRSKAEVTRFFDGLELWDPGVVLAHHWRPDVQVLPARNAPADEEYADVDVSVYAGVGIKQ